MARISYIVLSMAVVFCSVGGFGGSACSLRGVLFLPIRPPFDCQPPAAAASLGIGSLWSSHAHRLNWTVFQLTVAILSLFVRVLGVERYCWAKVLIDFAAAPSTQERIANVTKSRDRHRDLSRASPGAVMDWDSSRWETTIIIDYSIFSLFYFCAALKRVQLQLFASAY